VVCTLIIAAAIALDNAWRLLPPDDDCVRAAALYTGALAGGFIGAAGGRRRST
jgi:hypothetical protein